MHFWNLPHVWMLYVAVACVVAALWLEVRTRRLSAEQRASELRRRALDVSHPYGQAPETHRAPKNPRGWEFV